MFRPLAERTARVREILAERDLPGEPLPAPVGALDPNQAELLARITTRPDAVNHPAHYATGWSNGAEVIDLTEHLNFCRGNAVKYLARAGRKDRAAELEDLRKAAWYVQREIARLEGGSA